MNDVNRVTVESGGNEQPQEEQERLLALVEGREPENTDSQSDGIAEGGEQNELILGKFKSQDDLIKAYKELESKLGKPREQESQPENQPVIKPEGDGDGEGEGEGDDPPLPGSQIDFEKYNDRWIQNGQLSDEDYAELEAKGFTRETVAIYEEGLKARAERAMQEVTEVVGGMDNFNAMRSWAAANLDKSEIEAFNKAVTESDSKTREFALRGLYAKYTAAAGEPELAAGNPGGQNVSGYRSWQEVQAAMSDARYGKDRAYTADVEARMKVSRF